MSFRDLYNLHARASRLEGTRYARLRRYADAYFDSRYVMFNRHARAAPQRSRFMSGIVGQPQAERREALTSFVSENISELRNGEEHRHLSRLVTSAIVTPRRLTTFSRIVGTHAHACGSCETFHTADSSQSVRGYGQVCSTCLDDDFVMTQDTQRYMHHEQANLWENGDYYEAEEESAYPSEDADYGICSYHSHPHRDRKLVFHKPDGSDPHSSAPVIRIGVEWEMCCEDRDARSHAASKLDETSYALGETDGSLDEDTGMEVITGYSTIATVNRWMSEIHNLCNPDDSKDCGIHVNISGLSDKAFTGLAYFLNNFRGFNSTIAGRWDASYAHCGRADTLEEAHHLVSGSHDKYLHTNMRGWARHETRWMEVRIFKGTTSKSIAMARVQFTYALAAYCETLLPEECPSPESFIAWLNTSEETRTLVPEFLESFREHLARFAPAIMLNAVQEITVPAAVTNAPPQISAPVLVRYAAAGDIETLEPNEDGIETAPRTTVRRTRPTIQVSGVRGSTRNEVSMGVRNSLGRFASSLRNLQQVGRVVDVQATLPNVAVQESELSAEDRAARLRGEPIRRDFRNYSQWRGAHNRWLREREAGQALIRPEGNFGGWSCGHQHSWAQALQCGDLTWGRVTAAEDQLLAELRRPADPDGTTHISLNAAGGLIEEAAELSQSINS